MENVGKRIFASLLSLSMVSGLVSHNIKPVHASVDADTTIILTRIKLLQMILRDLECNGIQVICILIQMSNGHLLKKKQSF